MPEIEPKSIGIVRLSAIGDAVHALALANGLRRGFPDARIVWIIQPLPHEAVKLQPAVDRFIVFDPRAGVDAWRKVRRELASEPLDLLILPQVSFKGGMISRLARARVRLGFDRARSRELHGFFINERIPPRPAAHAVDQNLEFLDYLGVPVQEPEWNLVVTPEEKATAREFYSRFDRPVVALVPASSRPEKDWIAERYAELAGRIDAELGLQPLILGGPGGRERKIAERIVAAATAPLPVSLDRPLRTTIAKLSGAAIVVAPDTGPLHIAVGLGRPTVGLFGYTDPRRTGPYRFRELLVNRYADRGEEGTPITRATRPGRMEQIMVEDVFEKVRLAVERYGRARPL
jgi:heptosyltransferase I